MIFIVFMYMAAEFFALDKTDRKIIAALEENSRQSNKAIAKKARANEHVVAYRIQRLINEGIIKKIYCVINRGALFPFISSFASSRAVPMLSPYNAASPVKGSIMPILTVPSVPSGALKPARPI